MQAKLIIMRQSVNILRGKLEVVVVDNKNIFTYNKNVQRTHAGHFLTERG